MELLVSIIIPVYRERPYLNEALDSVVNQTYKNLEIIVIDDGSIDGSGEVCDEYARKDNRVKVIHQENRGVSNAWNISLDIMNGNFIAFCDSDDALNSCYIETMMSAILETQADIVVCKYTVHQTEGSLIRRGRLFPSIEAGLYSRTEALQALANSQLNSHVWNKLYKRTLWNNIRFPEGRIHQDIATLFKIFNLSEMINVIEYPLYLHRKRNGSVTSHSSSKYCEDLAWTYAQFAEFVKNNTPNIFTVEQRDRVCGRSEFFKERR